MEGPLDDSFDTLADVTAPAARSASNLRRRSWLATLAALPLLLQAAFTRGADVSTSDRKWYDAALAMLRQAESWGDQPYGAVLVLDDALVGEGPSRVVKNRDIDAHAEREAIKDAQRRLGRTELPGAILYSTSRPCRLCEQAAARANVGRMYFGPALTDAGAPRSDGGI